MMKTPKIKVSKTDLTTFLKEELEIDPFWDDVINPRSTEKFYKKKVEIINRYNYEKNIK